MRKFFQEPLAYFTIPIVIMVLVLLWMMFVMPVPEHRKKLKEFLPKDAENVTRLNYRYFKFSVDGDCFLLGREFEGIKIKGCNK